MNGVIVVDKPAAWTSHDVVAKLRGATGVKRIGHSGTLDPDATGLLLIGIGQATRLLRFLTDLKKTYTFEIVFGQTTSTLDDSGEETGTFDMDLEIDDVKKAAEKFVGDIQQIPPMVSAVQIGGKRLHQLAREGIEVERKPRPVKIYSFDIESEREHNVFVATVQCSSGTYVRTLAADLGEALGGGAHLRNLRRVSIGSFDESDAAALDSVIADPQTYLISAKDAMRDYKSVEIDGTIRQSFVYGQKVDAAPLQLQPDETYSFIENDQLVCVGHLDENFVKTDVVLASGGASNEND